MNPSITPNKTQELDKFLNAGTFTFTVDNNPQPELEDEGKAQNYVFYDSSLTKDYTMAKRTVRITATTFESEYGIPIPAESDNLGWEYSSVSISQNIYHFVKYEGADIGEYSYGDKAIYDGKNSDGSDKYISLATYTPNITDSSTGGTLTPADTTQPTNITLDAERISELNTGVATQNYSIIVTNHGSHKIIKQKVNIQWDEDLAFTYDGTDQTKNADNSYRTQKAYFYEAQSRKNVYFYVFAVEEIGRITPISFTNVKADNVKYVFFVSGFSLKDYEDNYQLPGSSDSAENFSYTDRFHEVDMLPREVVIKASAITAHEYGEAFETALEFTHSQKSDESTGFVNGYEANFRVSTELEALTPVGTYTGTFESLNVFVLKMKGSDGAFGIVEDEEIFADGYNYKVTYDFTESIKVVPRKVLVTISTVSHEYGLALQDIYGKATLSYTGDSETNKVANVDSSDNKDIYTIVTLVGESDILSSAKYPNAGKYNAILTSASANYEISYSFNSNTATLEVGANNTATLEEAYTIGLSTIFTNATNGVKTTAYTATYDGLEHAAAKSFTAKFYNDTLTATKTATQKSLTLGGSGSNKFTAAAGDNALKVLFRASSDGEYPQAWGNPTVNGDLTIDDDGYEWSDTMPSFTRAGTYYVYYAVVADNHVSLIGETYVLTVTIEKKAVTVSANFFVYYTEVVPEDFQPSVVFDGFVNGETIENGKVVGYDANDDIITVSVPTYTAGTSVKGTYAVTLNINMNVSDYTFSQSTTKSSNMEVRTLPLVLTVKGDLKNTYYLGGTASSAAETKYDLTKLGAGDFEDNYTTHTYTLKVKESTKSDLGVAITDIWSADYTDISKKNGQKIFTLKTDALDGFTGRATNDVDTYDVTYSMNTGYDNKYALEYSAVNYVIEAATFSVGYMHGYGTTPLGLVGRPYNEENHYVLHQGQYHGDDMTEGESPATFAQSVDGKAIKWTFYLATGEEAEDGYNTEAFWTTTHSGKTVEDKIPTVIDQGNYVIYYRLTLANHETAYGYQLSKINKGTNAWTNEYGIKDVNNNSTAWTYGAWADGTNPNGYSTTNKAEILPVATFNRVVSADGTVTKNYPVVKLYKQSGDDEWTLTATYTADSASNTVLSWLAGNSATMNGDTYLKNGAVLGAGKYKVTYSMENGGTKNYDAIAEKEFLFTIAKKELSVTAVGFEIVYGEAVKDADKKFTVTGFVNGERQEDIIGTAKPAFIIEKGGNAYVPGYINGSVGEYTIRLSTLNSDFEDLFGDSASSNYTVRYLTGTMTVVQRKIHVTFGSLFNSFDFNKSEIIDGQPQTELIQWNEQINSDGKQLIQSVAIDASQRTLTNGSPIHSGDMLDGSLYHNYVFSYTTTALLFNDDGEVTGTNSASTNAYPITGSQFGETDDNYAHSKNYVVTYTDGYYTINRARLTASPVVPSDLVYDGKAKTVGAPAVVGNISFTVYYEKLTSGTYGAEGATYDAKTQTAPKDEGTYRVSVEASSTDYIASTSAVRMVITPKPIDVTVELHSNKDGAFSKHEGDVVYYRDEYRVVATYGKDGDTSSDRKVITADASKFNLTISYTFAGTTSVAKAIAAGHYDAILSCNSSNYTIIVDIHEDFEEVFESDADNHVEFSIDRKKINTPTATDNGGRKIYDGNEFGFVIDGYTTEKDHASVAALKIDFTATNALGNAVSIADNVLSGEKWTWTFKNAGGYRAVVSFDSANYEWTDGTRGSITFTYTVAQKTLYVKASDANITYGDEFTAGNVTVDLLFSESEGGQYTVSGGFVTGDAPATVVGGYGTTIATLYTTNGYTNKSAAESSYSISVASGIISADNYKFELNRRMGMLTVLKRALTVTIVSGENKEVAKSVYSGTTPDLTSTDLFNITEGTLPSNGETKANLGITFSLGCTLKADGSYDTANTVGAGNHRLTPRTTNNNYEITFEGAWTGTEESGRYTGKAGIYVIERKELTVNVGISKDGAPFAENGYIVYGDEFNNYVTVNYSGWVGTDAPGKAPSKKYVFSAKNGTVDYVPGGSQAGDVFTLDIVNKADDDFFRDYTIASTVVTGTMTVATRYIGVSVENRVFEPKDGVHGEYENISAVPVYTNTIEDYDPSVVLTYTGSLANGSALATAVPQRVGNYKVTITLQKNDNEEYNYKFGTESSPKADLELDYKITPKKVELQFANSTIDLSTFESENNEGHNELVGYIDEIMEVANYTFASTQSNEANLEDGKMIMRFRTVGVGSATIRLKPDSDYEHDYILVAVLTGAEAKNILLTFSVNTSAVDFHVTIAENKDDDGNVEWKGWVYSEYDEAEHSPKSRSSQVPDEQLKRAVISYTYYAFADKASYDKWLEDLKKFDETMTAVERQELIGEIDKLRYSAVVPTNAGYYMVRAQLSEMSDQGISGAVAAAVFTIKQKVVDAPTLVKPNDTHEGDCVYWVKQHRMILDEGFDNATMYLSTSGGAYSSIVGNDVVNIYATNAGIHEVYLTLRDTKNYVWAEDAEAVDGKVTLLFEIKKGTATIYDFEGKTTTYGEPIEFSATAEFGAEITYTYVKLDADGEEESEERTLGLPSSAGVYHIYATSAADSSDAENWLGETKYVTLTVNKAELIVIVGNANVVYGEELPEFTFTVDGWKSSDKGALNSALTATLANKLDYATSKNGGEGEYAIGTSKADESYSINATVTSLDEVNGTLDNYMVKEEATSGTLTILKRSILIKVSDNFHHTFSGAAYTIDNESSPNPTNWTAEADSVNGYYTVYGTDVLTVKFNIVAGMDGAIFAGAYTVNGELVATIDSASYEVSFASGTLLISPNVVTITDVMVTVGGDTRIVYNHGNDLGLVVTYTASYIWNDEPTKTTGIIAGQTNNVFPFRSYFVTEWSGIKNNGTALGSVAPKEAGKYRASIVQNEKGKEENSIQAVTQSYDFVVQKYTLDKDLLQAEIDKTSYTYKGSAVGPDSREIVLLSEDAYEIPRLYTVAGFNQEINVGTYSTIIAKLDDADNYAWSETVNDTRTFSFTIAPITGLSLTLTAYDASEASWQYDGTTHKALFAANLNNGNLGDLSSRYVYYVQVSETKPVWTTIAEAATNGWTAFNTTQFAAVGSSLATDSNENPHWIVVALAGNVNYNEASTGNDIKSYTVNKRTINITINGNEDVIAGEYRENLTAAGLPRPAYTRDHGILPEGVNADSIITADMRVVFSYSGLSWSGKNFGEGGYVEAGKYGIVVTLPEAATKNFVLGTVSNVQYIVKRATLYSDDIVVISKVYDGVHHEPSEFIDADSVSDLWEAKGTSRTEVGTYSFNVVLTETASYNYYWYRFPADATNATEDMTTERQLRFSITRAELQLTEGKFSYTNSGESFEAVFAGTDNETSWTYDDTIENVKAEATVETTDHKSLGGVSVTLQYSPKGTSLRWTTERPTEAGEYYVRIYVAQTNNYGEAYSDSASYVILTIDKKALDKPIAPAGSAYNGSRQSTEIVGFNPILMSLDSRNASANGWEYEYILKDGTTPIGVRISATHKGDYVIPVNLRYPENYKWKDGNSDSVSVTWTIYEAENFINVTEATSTVVYGEKGSFSAEKLLGELEIGFAKVDEFVEADKSTLAYAKITEQNYPKNAGKYWIRFHIEGTTDYSGVDEYRQFTITKAELTVIVGNANVVYGEELPEFTFTVDGWKYSDKDSDLLATLANDLVYATSKNGGEGEYAVGTSKADESYSINATVTSLDELNATLDNYTLKGEVESGTLTVLKRRILINISDNFTHTYSGYAYTIDNESSPNQTNWKAEKNETLGYYAVYGTDVLTVNFSVIGEAVDVGVYTVEGSLDTTEADDRDNYDVDFSFGKLTISENVITITNVKVMVIVGDDGETSKDITYDFGNLKYVVTYTASYTWYGKDVTVENLTFGSEGDAFPFKQYFVVKWTGAQNDGNLYNAVSSNNSAQAPETRLRARAFRAYSEDSQGVELNAPQKAGKYIVTVTFSDEAKNAANVKEETIGGDSVSAANSEEFDVQKFNVDKDSLQAFLNALDTVYNGSNQVPTAEEIQQKADEFGIGEFIKGINVEKQTEAGTYNAIAIELNDPNNFAWSYTNDEGETVVEKDKNTTFSFTIEPNEEPELKFEDEVEYAWNYDGTAHIEYFKAKFDNITGDFSSEYLYFVQTSENAPTWTNIADAEANGWAKFTATEFKEVGSNVATNASEQKHWIVIALAETDNYAEASTGIKSYVVNKREVNITVNGGKDFIAGSYGDATLLEVEYYTYELVGTLPKGVKAEDIFTADIRNGVSFSYNGLSWSENEFGTDGVVEAGKYAIVVELPESASNFELAGTKSGSYVVKRAELFGMNIKVKEIEYDGVAHKPSEFIDENSVSDRWETEGEARTEAGTYSFKAVIKDINNYYWSRYTTDATSVDIHEEINLQFTIVATTITFDKGTFSYTNNSTLVDNTVDLGVSENTAAWTYNDDVTNVKVTADVKVGNGNLLQNVGATLYYSSTKGAKPVWTAAFPTQAGEYYAIAYVTGTNNYKAIYSASNVSENGSYTLSGSYVVITIDKKELDKPALENPGDIHEGDCYYTGNPHHMQLSKAYDNATMSVSVSAGAGVVNQTLVNVYATEADQYTIRISLRDADNYKWKNGNSEPHDISWTIHKANNKFTTVESDETAVYGTKGVFSAIAAFGTVEIGFAKAVEGVEANELVYTRITEYDFPRNAGEYWIRFHVAGTKNYSVVDEYRQFTVTKAVLTATINDVSVTYGSNVSVFRGFTVTGYKYSDSTLTNAVSAELKVVGYTAGNDAGDYSGAIRLDGTATIGGTEENYSVTFVNGTLHVQKKAIEVNVLSQEQTYEAGGDVPKFDKNAWEVATRNGLFGDDEIVINLSLEVPSNGKYNVGSYVIKGSVGEGKKTANYDISITAGALGVVAKEINITRMIASDCVYGSVTAVTYNLNGVDGAKGDNYQAAPDVSIRVTYFADNAAASTVLPVNAGTYSVRLVLEGAESGNYKLVGSFEVTLYVARKQLSVVTAQNEANKLKSSEEYESAPGKTESRDRYHFKPFYTGEAQTVKASEFNAFVEIMQNLENFLLASDRGNAPFTASFDYGTNVGTYNIHLTLTDEIANNYVWASTGSDKVDMTFEVVQETANYVSLVINEGKTEAAWEYDGYEAGTGSELTVAPHKGFYSYSAKFGGNAATVRYQYYIVTANGDVAIDYAPVNVGEYKLQIVVPETDNYAGCVSNKLPVSITPRKLIVSFSDARYMGGEYGGTIHPASTTLAIYDTSLTKHNIYLSYVTMEYAYYGTSNDNTWSYVATYRQNVPPTKAGEYTVRATLGNTNTNEYNNNFVLVDSRGDLLENGAETEFVITKAYVYKDRISVRTIDWDGNNHTAREMLESINSNYGTKYFVADDDNISRSEVGTHIFYVSLVDKNNYRWASDAYAEKVQLSFTIKRTASLAREIEVTKMFGMDANLPNLGFMFTQVPNVNPSVIYYVNGIEREFEYMDDYILIYAKEGTLTPSASLSWKNNDEVPAGWSTTLPENIGKYVALAWIDSTNFHGYSAQIHFAISPFNAVVVMTTDENGVYGEKEPSFTALAYDAKDLNSETGKLNVGAQTVVLKPGLNGVSDELYLPHTVYYTGTGSTRYDRSTTMPTEAGTYVRELVLSTNYENGRGSTITCEFRIEPKEISVSDIPLSKGSVYYDGTSHLLDKAFIESYGGGIIEVVDGLPVNEGVVNVGEYAVELRLRDNRNYVWKQASKASSEYATAYFKVEKSTVILYVPTITGWSYGASHLEPTVTGMFQNGNPFVGTVVYEYAVRGTDNWSTDVPVNAGKYMVRAKYNGGDNCDSFTSKPAYFSISRAKLEKPTAGDDVEGINGIWTFIPEDYFGALQGIAGNVATSDGSYRATVSIIDKNNYEWADGTQSDVVISWTAAPNMTTFYIIVASLGGLAALLALALIPVIIVARRRKKNNAQPVQNA